MISVMNDFDSDERRPRAGSEHCPADAEMSEQNRVLFSGEGSRTRPTSRSDFVGDGLEPPVYLETTTTTMTTWEVDAARVLNEGQPGRSVLSATQMEISSLEDNGGSSGTDYQGAALLPEPEEDKGEVASVSQMKIDLLALEAAKLSRPGSSNSLLEEDASETRRVWSHRFEPGDMVWGKVKSHPWWPGHVYNEAFASTSVRRTKREGHVLVAFFGDSSYGWFDPAELIPFEPHFAEKSRQTNLRNFVKAVEEAVDEASRRKALGLICNCRNRLRFRPTSVDGYFVADVDGFEPGGIYSDKQIEQARANFEPAEAVYFVQELALSSQSNEERTIDYIKNMSIVLAYRRAVFEEFDETYAEAFGLQPVRPSGGAVGKFERSDKVPARAPLSGPLVIAEALGERKTSMKTAKMKDSSKKDKYLFKRRDESNTQGVVQSNISSGDYVLQKRVSAITNDANVSSQGAGRGADFMVLKFDESDSIPHANTSAVLGANQQKDQPLSCVPPLQGKSGDRNLQSETNVVQTEVPGNSDIEEKTPDASGVAAVQIRGGDDAGIPVEPSVVSNAEGMAKATKPVIPPLDGANSEISFTEEKKRKKKKKKKIDLGSEVIAERPLKRSKTLDGEILRKIAGKSIGITSAGGILPQNGVQETEDGSGSACGLSFSNLAPSHPASDLSNIHLPQLIEDLLALALNPFHGLEYDSPAVVRHVLLRFRSLVYQKSLVLQPSSEPQASEFRAKPTQDSIIGSAEIKPGVDVRGPASKPSKHVPRADDPAKMGRKRAPSDRQEEMSTKRMKKVNELKAITAEKKAAALKDAEGQKVEKKDAASVVVTPVKLTKAAEKHAKSAESNKKPQPLSARSAEPAALVLKFPQGATLPSVPQLKARFGRFGPLDVSAVRLYWKSYTCRVVYKHKGDAQAAFNYAIRNNTLFGPVRVTYQLKDYEAPGSGTAAEPADGIRKPDDGASEAAVPSHRSGNGNTSCETRPLLQQPRGPPVLLRSCLKKPAGDDGGTAMVKESPRVKFLLGDEEDSRGSGEQMVVASDASSGDGVAEVPGLVSNSSWLDVTSTTSSKNVNSSSTTMISPPPAPLIPLAPPLRIRPENAPPASSIASGILGAGFDQSRTHLPMHLNEVERRRENVDISHQMLSLMIRCSDIISNVKCTLGYVPYHPL